PTQPNPTLTFLPAFLPSKNIALFPLSRPHSTLQARITSLSHKYLISPKVKHMLLTVNEREAMDSTFCEIKVSLLTIEGLFTIPYEHLFTN
ncbi:hypothetical protein, partial [Paenibacillus odorifer]|uniref:hypothetical protein n=1 Tax=Paenibacillus odorifer TaxID=189426 RepID=UPI001C37683A